jgi:hypothetical protein
MEYAMSLLSASHQSRTVWLNAQTGKSSPSSAPFSLTQTSR